MADRQIFGTARIPGPLGIKPWSAFVTASSIRSKDIIPSGARPTKDGEPNHYDVSEYAIFWVPEISPAGIYQSALPTRGQRRRAHRTGKYKVVFVNGQEGNPMKHKMQACALAAVSGGPVEGIYNASSNVVGDTLKSLWMKLTSSALMNAESAVVKLVAGQRESEETIRKHLRNRDCPASATLFNLLLQEDYSDAFIVGHSQGNIAICNAINGVLTCRGESAVRSMKVIAIASPTVTWENEDIVTVLNMKNDLVGWLSGHRGTIPASVGGWSGITSDSDVSQMILGYERARLNILTHSFYLYLAELWEKLVPLFP